MSKEQIQGGFGKFRSIPQAQDGIYALTNRYQDQQLEAGGHSRISSFCVYRHGGNKRPWRQFFNIKHVLVPISSRGGHTEVAPKKAGRKAGSVNDLADTLAGMNLAPCSSADPISTTSHGLTVIKGGAVSLNVPEHVVVPFTSRGIAEDLKDVTCSSLGKGWRVKTLADQAVGIGVQPLPGLAEFSTAQDAQFFWQLLLETVGVLSVKLPIEHVTPYGTLINLQPQIPRTLRPLVWVDIGKANRGNFGPRKNTLCCFQAIVIFEVLQDPVERLNLSEGLDLICGAVVSLRSKVDHIQVWTQGKDDIEKLNLPSVHFSLVLGILLPQADRLEYYLDTHLRCRILASVVLVKHRLSPVLQAPSVHTPRALVIHNVCADFTEHLWRMEIEEVVLEVVLDLEVLPKREKDRDSKGDRV
ncbi:hypothetical protein B0H14DRAFT_2595728 [Mycena olivaceomarginata]|nr:hypothetical protein B0H14DRAFT_2595728 [Mycena olivaceomarginata]